jgi:hypothetical protein
LSVVLDANALVVLVLDRQRATAVEELLRVWEAKARICTLGSCCATR